MLILWYCAERLRFEYNSAQYFTFVDKAYARTSAVNADRSVVAQNKVFVFGNGF